MRDPKKTLEENYLDLNFKSAYASTESLIALEKQVELYHSQKHKKFIFVWEYGYYFSTLLIQKSHIHKSYLVLAALYTEANSAIRATFNLNLQGYHSDSIVTLRKAHESVIRILACRKNPQNTWKILSSSDISKASGKIKLDLKWVYDLESSFTHSNKLKTFQAGKDLLEGKEKLGVSWGPQQNEKEFFTSACLSVFWLFVLIKSANKIFSNQIEKIWLDKQTESCEFLKDYLKERKSTLFEECAKVEKSLLVF